jgi:hypothetical protein
MMSYTSGPWEVRFWNGDEWPDKRISVSSDEGAIVISPRYESERFMHDAQLISAAPDLLEAIMELRRGTMAMLSGNSARCFDETMARVDKAINKAIGAESDLQNQP